MPNILITWELGSGLGHVGPLRAVGGELARRGHAVAIAAPNVELCRQAFAGTEVKTLPAPVLPLSIKRLKFPCTYSDTLHDCGYSSADDLTAAVGEWLRLFDAFAPDLLLADHSPTALLAARMRDFPVATIGPGFVCPPDISPLPSLRREIPEPHWAAEVEQTVLTSMNIALAAYQPVEKGDRHARETSNSRRFLRRAASQSPFSTDGYGAPALGRVTEIFGNRTCRMRHDLICKQHDGFVRMHGRR